MAQVCKSSTIRPSITTRLNLRAVESSLRRYTTIVQGTRDAPANQGNSSKQDICSDQENVIITIESDNDSANNDENRISDGEDDVWADAFEYQEEMLLQPRLSQVSTNSTRDKENRDPYEFARRVRTESKAQDSTYEKQANQKAESITTQETVLSDRFARTSPQYMDVPLPRKHISLCKEEYFSMKNNPTKHGSPPVVIYVTNENQLNSVITLLQGPILSLDMEWIAWTKKKNISLIQLSDANTVLLIQICRFATFPRRLREIIEDPTWIKCGVAIMGADASRLRDVYNVWAQGICELSFFARLVDRETHGPKNNLVKLSTLAYHYLGSELAKGDVRCSDWSRFPLTQEQRHYAAVDAYAGYLIFAELERRRQTNPEMRNIWPPVSACPAAKPKPISPYIKPRTAYNTKTSGKTSESLREIRTVLSTFKQDFSSMSDQPVNRDVLAEVDTFVADSPARLVRQQKSRCDTAKMRLNDRTPRQF
ncbi:protein of unknown function [Taphrina deformans PYCC 5710]|uniref:3'-5' exonuclease domain-containing protein n=1 Tax=Taphrina deformans (strain PYCC 5710 / ATCC 11124 / CBS 356.35 / IMI 108563 / JCM 9778 / NBRC 8474) TaxID=1097556 RepID=R4XLL8_TAPDE|nr:protein of unknown function [Taphrina deformans PYCC 5710]|eukprot:CCG84190.1 protein of unknown function [Taphrina deformans PYCC 5710]